MIEPGPARREVEAMFPATARYVRGHGYIEIGEQEMSGFIVRAIGDGGLAFEDDRPGTLAGALATPDAGLVRWFEEQGHEEDDRGHRAEGPRSGDTRRVEGDGA